MNNHPKACVTDPLPYMIAYLDGRGDLKPDEIEILLFALYMECKGNKDGLVQRAVKAIRERPAEGRKP